MARAFAAAAQEETLVSVSNSPVFFVPSLEPADLPAAATLVSGTRPDLAC